MPSTNCEICGEPSESPEGFCRLHILAYKNLKQAYDKWKEAYSGSELTQTEFMKRLLSINEAGRAVKETASFLIKRGCGLELH